jgi:hypothetical protein
MLESGRAGTMIRRFSSWILELRLASSDTLGRYVLPMVTQTKEEARERYEEDGGDSNSFENPAEVGLT